VAAESELEKELTKRARQDDPEAKALKVSFDSIKAYLVKYYYPWVQANCPYFTDHGEAHVASVMHSASELVSEQLAVKKGRRGLTPLEIYLILTAILWHDVGMVIDRATHADLVSEMADKVSDMFPNPTIKDLVSRIAKAHKGMSGLDKLPVEAYCTLEKSGLQVNPAELAAIVRFADEISENHTRASTQVLGTVPDPQKIFWLYALSVSSCTAQPSRERIRIDFRFDAGQVVTQWPNKDFQAFAHQDKIPLLTYALCRLEKINNEREYCLRYFSSIAPIRQIEAFFSIQKGGKELNGYDHFSLVLKGGGVESSGYPAIKIVQEFFDKNPTWKIDAIAGVINS
jgi:metal-dependent HD superfamily phosphatase/phosphodiesterase